MTAIYKRELRAYFTSMVGYFYTAIVVFFTGIYFMANNLFNGSPKFSHALMSVIIVFLAAIPILTMRSMAEDRRGKTDQLLLTAPVRTWEVVLGKYFAVVTVLGIPMLLSCLCPLIIAMNGTASLLSDYASILAFFLLGCAFAAVGVFISALTESQIIAAVGTFAALLALYLWSDLMTFLPDAVGEPLGKLSLRDRFYQFAQYDIFDWGTLVLYVLVAALFLYLTVQWLGARRRGRAFSAVSAVLAAALVIAVNLAVGQIPSQFRELDMSTVGLYTVTETSQTYLAGLSEEVEITVLQDESTVDPRIVRFLDRYVPYANGKVKLQYVDPVAYPSAPETYGGGAGDVVVSCAATGRSETVGLDELIGFNQLYYYYYGQYVETDFDVEGRMTSAIDLVVGEVGQGVYCATGHGETDLGDTVARRVEKLNLGLDTVGLMQSGAIPEDCAVLLFYAPTADLTAQELQLVRDYLSAGGQVMLLLAEEAGDLPNFTALMEEYGLAPVEGYIADPQRYYQSLGSVYAIFPAPSASSAVTYAYGEDDLTLMLNARGLQETVPARDTVTVEPFLTTSTQALAVDGENQTQGSYILAAAASEEGGGRLTVYSSASFINEELLGTFSNVANVELFLDSLTVELEDISDISIPAKNLETVQNTVRSPGLWSLLFLALIPLATLAAGLWVWLSRRKR